MQIQPPTPPAHPHWCDREHQPPGWPGHASDVGAIWLSADLGYSVNLVQHQPGQPVHVELYRHSRETSVTTLDLGEAAHLARLLDLAARLAGENPVSEDDNPVIDAVAEALRVLGCTTRTDAEMLLSLTVVELTDREQDIVLARFPAGQR
jgi:hypothetical protein